MWSGEGGVKKHANFTECSCNFIFLYYLLYSIPTNFFSICIFLFKAFHAEEFVFKVVILLSLGKLLIQITRSGTTSAVLYVVVEGKLRRMKTTPFSSKVPTSGYCWRAYAWVVLLFQMRDEEKIVRLIFGETECYSILGTWIFH